MGARRLKEEPLRPDEPWDHVDVPAAVVCALCGDPGCAGCALEATTSSGILAIVPWERPGGGPLVGRLWTTARLTTKEAETFFGGLPDGPLAPALAFALLAELLATTAWALVWTAVTIAIVPRWCAHIALDPHSRGLALRVAVAALPAFAFMLVGAHAAHGLSLERGARKAGAPSARRKALRFGLYATGWDLVIGPLGAVLLAGREGIGAAGEVLHLGSGLPTKSAKAFLRGIYGLDAARVNVAITSSYVMAVVATLVAAFLVVALVAALIFVFPPHFFAY
jgi:hypothetical protein